MHLRVQCKQSGAAIEAMYPSNAQETPTESAGGLLLPNGGPTQSDSGEAEIETRERPAMRL